MQMFSRRCWRRDSPTRCALGVIPPLLDRNSLFLGPFQQLAADVFGAIVHPNGAKLPAPFDDEVETSGDPFRWQREIGLDAKPFTVEVVQQVQQPELAAIAESVGYEIHGPDQVRAFRRGQRVPGGQVTKAQRRATGCTASN